MAETLAAFADFRGHLALDEASGEAERDAARCDRFAAGKKRYSTAYSVLRAWNEPAFSQVGAARAPLPAGA